MFYPVKHDPNLRIFNNQIDFYRFLAEANPEINVSLSALLPPTEFVVGKKRFPCRTIVDFFEQIAEQTGLPIDTKASTIRMGAIFLFFTENLDENTLTPQSDETTAPAEAQDAEPATTTTSTDAAPDSVDAILQQAAALENEADKSGSKVALEAFAQQYGVSLARNKTFANMMKDFEAALRT